MGNTQESTHTASDQIKQIYSIYSRSLINKKRLHPTESNQKISKDVLKQLFQSFSRYGQYKWSHEITPLFVAYFADSIGALWANDREIFYRQMLENSGFLDQVDKKCKSYQDWFYNCQAIKLRPQLEDEDQNTIQGRIHALNSSIMDEGDIVPFVINKKRSAPVRKRNHVIHSMMQKVQKDYEYETLPESASQSYNSEYYDEQILKSSVIVPDTVFVERLNEESKYMVNNMLNFYKVFSQSLQQMVRNLSLIACPLKHFEIYLKRRVRIKKIRSTTETSSASVIHDNRSSALLRKKKQYNNSYLLTQIRDFTEAYTEFIWKYLNLYRIVQTQFSTFITIETAYGVVLKLIWSFASWIGERGFDWQESQIPQALQKLYQQQEKINQGNKGSKSKKKVFEVDGQIIRLGCQLSQETNPQKYLKKIVIIYRQLSKKCTSADQLILYYQNLFQQLAKKGSYKRLFKMQSIIDKLLKMEDSSGEICYAWTTWNIMVETIKKIITTDSEEKQVEKDFQKYLEKMEKSRLSG